MDNDELKTDRKRYDWLKPTQFKVGNPGGPGRPKGPSLKNWLKEKFKEMTEEERIEFINKIDPIKAWEMGEGRPDTRTDVTSAGKPIVMPTELYAKYHADPSTEENSGEPSEVQND